MVCAATLTPRIQLLDCFFDDFQRVAAATLSNIQMDCQTRLVRATLKQGGVPHFAIALASHKYTLALWPVSAPFWHQPNRGTAPKTPPRYFL